MEDASLINKVCMYLPCMSKKDGIDTTGYVILDVMTDPQWKSRIHSLMEDADDEPITDIPSIQTIGRRVDDLCDEGLLASCILSPDDVGRDLIIGYRRTEKGDDAMDEKRGTMLQEVAHTTANVACGQTRTMSTAALTKMIADEFDLDAAGESRIEDEYGEEELLSLLTLHFAQENADKHATRHRSHTNNNKDKNFQHLVE